MSNAPVPGGPRRRKRGKLAPLSANHKQKRLERRKRRKTWAARIWARRHIKG